MKPITISEDGVAIAVKDWFKERGVLVESLDFEFTNSLGEPVTGVTMKVRLMTSDMPPEAPKPLKKSTK